MKKAILSVPIFFIISCNKEPMPATAVLMRINNETSQGFTQILTNNESFNNVPANATTGYQSFFKIISVPSATLIKGTDTAYVGLVIIDMPTYFTSGKYTLQIKKDTLTASGYSCEYKED